MLPQHSELVLVHTPPLARIGVRVIVHLLVLTRAEHVVVLPCVLLQLSFGVSRRDVARVCHRRHAAGYAQAAKAADAAMPAVGGNSLRRQRGRVGVHRRRSARRERVSRPRRSGETRRSASRASAKLRRDAHHTEPLVGSPTCAPAAVCRGPVAHTQTRAEGRVAA